MNEAKFNSIVPAGSFFSVKFKKRDGSIRSLVARCGVRKYVKGTGTRTKKEGLVTCFEPAVGKGAECYRSFYTDSIVELHADHKTYDSEGNEVKVA